MKENTIKAALAAALGALCAYGVQLLVPVLVLVVVMLLDYATGMAQRCAESDAWGAAYVPARQEAPKPAEPAQGDTLYRVQVGAFAVRANAEKMLDRLKKAGFTGFVVVGKK